jgi:tRNA (guanine37-N1)-methyltransferase
VARWRRQESLRRTRQRRPDLLERAALSEAEREFLRQFSEKMARKG